MGGEIGPERWLTLTAVSEDLITSSVVCCVAALRHSEPCVGIHVRGRMISRMELGDNGGYTRHGVQH